MKFEGEWATVQNRNVTIAPRLRLYSLLALLVCLLLALPACFLAFDEQPYYTRSQALSFFQQHQTGFTEAAQAWLYGHAEDSFHLSRHDDGRFYWNTTGLACSGATCRVRTGNGHETSALPFAAAAAQAGVQPDDLRHWITVSRKLNLDSISMIGAGLPASQRYLELKMRGSSRIAYGFVYVPDGHDAASRELIQTAKGAAPNHGFTYLQPLNAHWAYFEARS